MKRFFLAILLFLASASGVQAQQVLGNFSTADHSEWPQVVWLRDLTNNWDEGLIKNASSQSTSTFSKPGFGIHMHESKQFSFWSTNWNPLFAIDGGSGNAYLKGKFGIGTNTPRSKFEVNDWNATLSISSNKHTEAMTDNEVISAINFYKHYGVGYAGAIKLLQAGGGNSWSPAHLAFYTTSGGDVHTTAPEERLRITSDGKVGIGTSNPNAKLDVSGITIIAGNFGNLDKAIPGNDLNYLANSGKMVMGWNRSAGAGETDFISNQGGGGSGGFAFYNHDNNNIETQLMRIWGNGNVGIGTTDTKGFKLAVAGPMVAESVKVKLQNTWAYPDYVFKPSYKLPSLTEVESYIKENQHLPEIPSEKEAKANGMDLGEMNAKLLKKIEELTLYMIDLEKKVKKLEQQNKSN